MQSQVSSLKHSNKMYHEHEYITFLLNATYTKIINIEMTIMYIM